MKQWVVIGFVMLAGLTSCRKADLDAVDNLNGGQIEIIGHGGSGFPEFNNPYPSNTLASIRRATEGFGLRTVEVDLQLSADSVLILYHDELLSDATACQGCVQGEMATAIQDCRYNNTNHTNLTDEQRVNTFSELLALYQNEAVPPTIVVDARGFNFCTGNGLDPDRWARAFVREVDAYGARPHVIFTSRSVRNLQAVHQLAPEIRLMLDTEDISGAISDLQAINAKGVIAPFNKISAADVNLAHDNGLEVYLFGVRTRSSALTAIELSADGIITDNIPLVQDLLSE